MRAVRLLALALGLGCVALGAPAAEAAGPTDPTTFVACGYVSHSTVSDCMTLPAALAAATANIGASAGPSTIMLLPGLYCPIDIPKTYHQLSIVGAGAATLSGTAPDDAEAALSTFEYDAPHCGSAPGAMITDAAGYYGLIVLQNIAVDGSGTGGPSTGLDLGATAGFGGGLTVRDVEVRHFAAIGVRYQGDNLQLQASALLDNATGLVAFATGNVDDSTIAGSTSSGVEMSGSIGFYNDTITHNNRGVYIQGFGNEAWAYNNIVADNTTDCAGTVGAGGDWEYQGGHGSAATNLLGTSCLTTYTDSDLTWAGGSLPDPALNGGPTHSVLTPAQAEGTGSSYACHVDASDQREGKPGATCDIGSVDHAASLIPDVTSSAVDFGDIPVGEDSSGGTGVYYGGGGVVSVGQVSVSGAGFTLTYDNCTFDLLARRPNAGSCGVGITAHPTTTGTMTGTLTIPTTAGTLTEPISAHAVPPPDPSALTAPAGSFQPYGATPTLTGTLTDTTTHVPVTGASVELLARKSGSSVFQHVASGTTDSHGTVSIKLPALKRIATYEWSYAGDSAHEPVTSGTGKVVVVPVVQAALLHGKVHHGKTAHVSGTVDPTLAGTTVTLQRRTAAGWKTADTDIIRLQTLPDGRHTTGFALAWKPGHAGTYKLRVAVPQTKGLAPAHSAVLALTVT